MKTIPKKIYNSFSVANFFIGIANKHEKKVTHMKLQKIVYISHGWYLGMNEFPLIEERIEAWKHGPVIRPLYNELKHYGHDPITEKIKILDIIKAFSISTDFKIPLECYNIPNIEENSILSYLLKVWNFYSKYSAIELSNLTHLPGTPWHNAKHYGEQIITDKRIQEYYGNRSNK